MSRVFLSIFIFSCLWAAFCPDEASAFVLSNNEKIVVLSDSHGSGEFNSINISELAYWKFSPEDDLGFAEQDYDDTGWMEVGSVTNLDSVIPDHMWTGAGWFRIRFITDESQTDNIKVVTTRTRAAIQVFLNG